MGSGMAEQSLRVILSRHLGDEASTALQMLDQALLEEQQAHDLEAGFLRHQLEELGNRSAHERKRWEAERNALVTRMRVVEQKWQQVSGPLPDSEFGALPPPPPSEAEKEAEMLQQSRMASLFNQQVSLADPWGQQKNVQGEYGQQLMPNLGGWDPDAGVIGGLGGGDFGVGTDALGVDHSAQPVQGSDLGEMAGLGGLPLGQDGRFGAGEVDEAGRENVGSSSAGDGASLPNGSNSGWAGVVASTASSPPAPVAPKPVVQTTTSGSKSGSRGNSGTPSFPTVRLRGLPYTATVEDVTNFFKGFDMVPESVRFGSTVDGRPSGEGWVCFGSHASAHRAVTAKDRHHIGDRYVELFLQNPGERSNDPGWTMPDNGDIGHVTAAQQAVEMGFDAALVADMLRRGGEERLLERLLEASPATQKETSGGLTLVEDVNPNRPEWTQVRPRHQKAMDEVATPPTGKSPAPADTSPNGRSGGSTAAPPAIQDLCFNCGSVGHISRDCPKPSRDNCYQCGKPGHLAKDCKEGDGKGQICREFLAGTCYRKNCKFRHVSGQ